jgi:hypothetical protein
MSLLVADNNSSFFRCSNTTTRRLQARVGLSCITKQFCRYFDPSVHLEDFHKANWEMRQCAMICVSSMDIGARGVVQQSQQDWWHLLLLSRVLQQIQLDCAGAKITR